MHDILIYKILVNLKDEQTLNLCFFLYLSMIYDPLLSKVVLCSFLLVTTLISKVTKTISYLTHIWRFYQQKYLRKLQIEIPLRFDYIDEYNLMHFTKHFA